MDESAAQANAVRSGFLATEITSRLEISFKEQARTKIRIETMLMSTSRAPCSRLTQLSWSLLENTGPPFGTASKGLFAKMTYTFRKQEIKSVSVAIQKETEAALPQAFKTFE